MRWFSDPQRDSRDAIRAAQQALMHAGYSRAEAVAAFETHRQRVRAAVAAPRDVLRAGFLAGAATAVLGLAVLIVGISLVSLVPVPRSDPWPSSSDLRPPVPPQGDPGLGLPVELLPSALISALVLGLAGAGMALVTRNRWRRAGALDTFIDLAPRRLYLLEAAAVWLGVSGLIVAIVRVQAGPQMDDGGLALLVFFGIPVLASVFGFVFPSVYNRLLPRASPLDAAAYARPIIEREAALRVKADRELSGRSVAHHSIYERDRWADEVLARLDASNTARRRR